MKRDGNKNLNKPGPGTWKNGRQKDGQKNERKMQVTLAEGNSAFSVDKFMRNLLFLNLLEISS